MDKEGPPLESLLHRIAEIPDDFLAEPKIGDTGVVVVAAVLHDVAASLGVSFSGAQLKTFSGSDRKRDLPRLAMALVAAWTLSEEWFRRAGTTAPRLAELFGEVCAQLAQEASVATYVHDADRREELARLILAHLGFRPSGETKAQAQDRLTSLSVVERNRVLRASRQAEERARAVREALARKAAEESADKWTRE